MKQTGLDIQTDKTDWCSTDPAAPQSIHVDGHELPITAREPGIKVLGSWVSFTGSSQPEYKARHSAAWASFFRHKGIFCHREVSARQKLYLLQLIIRPCLLWAVCTLSLTQKFLKSLDTLQISMVAIMTGRARNLSAGEGWLQWYIETRRAARSLLLTHGYRMWSNDALFFYYMWGGHVARLPPQRYAVVAHSYKNTQWWKQRQPITLLCQ